MNRINNSQTKHKQNFNRKAVAFLKKLCCLPPLPTLLIALPSFALVFRVLAMGVDHSVIANAVYVLSAYALVISVTGAVRIGKWLRGGLPDHPVVQQVLNHPYAGRYLKESMFRAEVSLYLGLLINLLYAGIKLFSGIRYHSVWFCTLSVYYFLLAIMRFSLLHQVRKKVRKGRDEGSELRRCRLCGMILLILN